MASGLRTLTSWHLCLVWLTGRASFCSIQPRQRTNNLRRVWRRRQPDFSRFPEARLCPAHLSVVFPFLTGTSYVCL